LFRAVAAMGVYCEASGLQMPRPRMNADRGGSAFSNGIRNGHLGALVA